MAVDTTYTSDKDGVVVHVREQRETPPGSAEQFRALRKDFGKSAKAEDDGLIFVHGVNHGEIKLDDILPPWAD